MIKVIKYLFCFLLLPLVMISAAAAQNTEPLTEDLQSTASDAIDENIPEGAKELLNDSGIQGYDTDILAGFQFNRLFSSIFDYIKENLQRPFFVFGSIIGVLLLSALLNSLNSGGKEMGNAKYYHLVSIMAVMIVVMQPVVDCINHAVKAIYDCSNFVLSFIPVFTGVVAVSGKPISSMAYQSFLFGTIQVISQIASSTLLPLLGMYLAFCVISSLNTTIDLQGFASGIKKLVTWCIVFLLTIFVALLTVQGFVSGSADTVANKTAKFLIGSTIPVVGSALSDAYTSVRGCLGLMRDTIGTFGIIVSLCTFLPVLIETSVIVLVLNLSEVVGRVLGTEKVCAILKAISSVLTLIIGLILCYAIMLIVSTTIIMMISLGL